MSTKKNRTRKKQKAKHYNSSDCRQKSNSELLSQIETHYKLIKDYISLINQGKEHFFLPLAASIRILFFDQNFPGKISLMEYYFQKFNINAFCFSPQSLDELPISDEHLTMQFIGSYIWLRHDPNMRFYNLTSLTEWKKRKLVKLGEFTYTPYDIIRTFTDKEGAAHIDLNRKISYDKLLGITFHGNNLFQEETQRLIVELIPIIIFYLGKIINKLNIFVEQDQRIEGFNKDLSSDFPLKSFKAQFYLYIYKHEYQKAINLAIENIETFKNDEIIFRIAELFGNYDEYRDMAVKLLNEFILQHPCNYKAKMVLGLIYKTKLNDFEQAYNLLKDAAEINDRDDVIYFNLFLLEFEHFKHLALAEEKSLQYLYAYAHFLFEAKKDYNSSEIYYKKALEIDPFNPSLNNDLGWLYERGLKNIDFAIYHYWVAFTVKPNFNVAFNNYKRLMEIHYPEKYKKLFNKDV